MVDVFDQFSGLLHDRLPSPLYLETEMSPSPAASY